MKDSDEDSTRPARVFVSYSRTDLGHAGEIAAGLRFAGFSVLIDEESIERGEAWKAKLEQLIVSADVIVFMVSPQFVKSEMCAWELDRAIENGKRLVPVLLEETTGVPGELASLNYVRFDEGRSFIAGLETLSRTLKVDLSWIHDHTRLQQRALDWKAAGAEENRLLIGVDVADALNWLEAASSDLPPVTDDQRAFIRASSEAETRRQSEERKRLEAVRKAQRRLGWALAGGCVAVLAGLSLGIVQARANAMNKATVQVAFADLSLLEGRYDSAMRVAASGLAELEPFWNPESPALEIRLRAAAALTPHIASGGQPELSELVDKLAAERRLSPVDRTRLQRLMDRNPEDGQLRPASTIRLTSPDRKRRLSVSSGSGSIQLQNLESSTDGPVPITDITDHRGALLAAAFTPDSRLIVTSDRNGAMVFRETLT
ncbi:MAG: toll/interleukin-1 receptor domain-containing protein, partial [Pseudomonadota bacterium]